LAGDRAFWLEQMSFALGMLPHLLVQKPGLIYLGEYQLYCALFKLRQLLGLRFGLVLYTGGQAIAGAKVFDARRDFLHHVTDEYWAAAAYLPAHRQTMLPHFLDTDFAYNAQAIAEIKRQANGKPMVLSVGVLDKATKQMHLLINALSELDRPVFPVLLGQASADTPELRQLLVQKFGADGFVMTQVPHAQLGNWYRAADLFVLCSPKESFGLAMVEAAFHGLPVIGFNFPAVRYVLGPMATIVEPKQLSGAIAAAISALPNANLAAARTKFVTERYTWPLLEKSYLNLFTTLVQPQRS
jgi:glycosyltransferase involved in cell wall biosynthesis